MLVSWSQNKLESQVFFVHAEHAQVPCVWNCFFLHNNNWRLKRFLFFFMEFEWKQRKRKGTKNSEKWIHSSYHSIIVRLVSMPVPRVTRTRQICWIYFIIRNERFDFFLFATWCIYKVRLIDCTQFICLTQHTKKQGNKKVTWNDMLMINDIWTSNVY